MGKAESFFVEKDRLEGVIPSEYLEDIKDRRMLLSIYKGYFWDESNEDETPRGVALFVNHPRIKDCYELRYIYLSEDIRYSGISKILLDEAEKVLKKKETISFISFVPEISGSSRLFSLFNRYGFKEVEPEIKVAYSLADMLDTEFGYSIYNNLQKSHFIHKKEALVREQVVEFAKHMESKGKHFDIHDLDDTYSRFFIHNGKILGFFDLVYDEVLYLRQIFIEPGDESKYAIPLLLSDMLFSVEKNMTEDTLFIYQGKENFIESLNKVFGEPLLKETIRLFWR